MLALLFVECARRRLLRLESYTYKSASFLAAQFNFVWINSWHCVGKFFLCCEQTKDAKEPTRFQQDYAVF
jgi:hypothetical protein